ncbi:MAG: phosphotransferase [Burkholderiales bacterium]|nr:phosphotransferase [Burkholderiales bacterium]
MDRLEQLRTWASSQVDLAAASMVPASEDASFRRYFRLTLGRGSVIAMDAPPSHEDCSVFVRVARIFREAGANVPKILAQDLERGFLLLTDFGTTPYLQALGQGNADVLYRDALDALIRIQRASRAHALPEYDRGLLARELDLFPQWYVDRHLGCRLDATRTAALGGVIETLLANNLAQPRVFVHRDYHSRNLMVTAPNPGILDFQDAVFGPITYDLVSLLKDAYIEWPEARILDWCVRYWEMARAASLPVAGDFGHFYRDFEWMGVQRHLKVLGIFARLWHRDGKERYLADLPLVLRHLQRAAERYRELFPLADLLDHLHGRRRAVVHAFSPR